MSIDIEAPKITGVINERLLDNADLIVEYLKILKVDYVFGVPGGAIEPFYNALAKVGSEGPKVVVARHEAGAAFMAEGYTREIGKIGVCCATTGPGSTNLLTGVASAYVDSVPMLVITAQTPLPKFGKNALQESSCTAVDTVGIFKKCTRYSSLISHREQMNTKVIAALMAAHHSPKGPVHLSIPSDVFRQTASSDSQVNINRLIQDVSLTDNDAIEKLSQMLRVMSKVVLFLGKGCGSAIKEIEQFSELTNAPIVTGPTGKRWVDGFHKRYYGVYGFAGHKSAQKILENDDVELIIAVGTPITELGTGGWQEKLLSRKLVHIDTTIEHFSRTPMAKHHVCGDIQKTFLQLNDSIEKQHPQVNSLVNADSSIDAGNDIQDCKITLDDYDSCLSDIVPLKPQRIVTELAARIPNHFKLHIDAGNAWAWFTHYCHRKNAQGNYHIAMGFGSMGWAIGAAIGSTLGSKEPSVCITGDGSYLMAGQEITVALQHQLPVIYVILNDSELGMVKHGQRLGSAAEIGFELPSINYAQMAGSMGIEGITIATPKELIAIDWQRLGLKKGPTLINMLIDPNEVPPMGQRVKGLAEKYVSATPGG